ncbi:unnamed protein product, partial [Didymodactylos carnosus]
FENLIPTGRILIDRKCLIEMQNEPTLEKDETSGSRLLARFIHGCSTRNIYTIQTIDLNFLIKQNSFGENQIFELLTPKTEKWIVMIVKDPWLKTTLIEDIEFKKSSAQLNKVQN